MGEKLYIKSKICLIPEEMCKIDYFFGIFLDLSQYGDLHLGQTLGYSSLLRGTHSWPHRSQRYPSSLIFAITNAILLIVYNFNSKNI
jgi:hypothetical protein